MAECFLTSHTLIKLCHQFKSKIYIHTAVRAAPENLFFPQSASQCEEWHPNPASQLDSFQASKLCVCVQALRSRTNYEERLWDELQT